MKIVQKHQISNHKFQNSDSDLEFGAFDLEIPGVFIALNQYYIKREGLAY